MIGILANSATDREDARSPEFDFCDAEIPGPYHEEPDEMSSTFSRRRSRVLDLGRRLRVTRVVDRRDGAVSTLACPVPPAARCGRGRAIHGPPTLLCAAAG